MRCLLHERNTNKLKFKEEQNYGKKIYKICKDVVKVTDEEVAELRGIYKEQLAYTHPLKMATVGKQHRLGDYNRKVMRKLMELKKIIENGPEEELQEDMKGYIDKAINDYEDCLKHEVGKEIRLTDKEKELIEYGYNQASLDMGWEIHEGDDGDDK